MNLFLLKQWNNNYVVTKSIQMKRVYLFLNRHIDFAVFNFNLSRKSQIKYVNVCRNINYLKFINSFRESALWQGKQSIPGYSSRSPVFTLKQEPCHGQRTLWPDRTPAEEPHISTVMLQTTRTTSSMLFIFNVKSVWFGYIFLFYLYCITSW